MKRIARVIGITMLPLFTTLNCGSTDSRSKPDSVCDARVDPGWISDNEYQISAKGYAPAGSQSIVARRTQARSAAILCAQRAAYFLITEGEDAAGLNRRDLQSITIPSSFSGYFRGGLVQSEKYDENSACEIRFLIEAPNLRSRIK